MEGRLQKLTGQIKESQGIKIRHGMVLQARALVLANPYSMPLWMPQLLLILTKFLCDRMPITVEMTLLYFLIPCDSRQYKKHFLNSNVLIWIIGP